MKLKSGRKELKVRRCELAPTLYELYFDNGGEVPKNLSGKYTSEKEALNAALSYQVKKNRVEEEK